MSLRSLGAVWSKLLIFTALAGWAFCGRAAGQTDEPAETVTLSAAGAEVTLERATGRVTSVTVAGEDMTRRHPAGSERPFAFVEVEDLRDGRIYNPFTAGSTISGWKVGQDTGGRTLSFTQRYEGAPFAIAHALRQTPAGVRWEAACRLHPGQKLHRSVVVSWMLPAPYNWQFWWPSDTVSHRTDGVTPYRCVYAHTDHRPYGTIVPVVGLWGRRGGAAVFSPPDVRKCQIIFDVQTQRISDPGKGILRNPEDLQMLRVAHHTVGLRAPATGAGGAGKELRLAICLAGVRPDWRAVMGHYVKSYPELFEPIPAARKYEGMYGINNATRLKGGNFDSLKSLRVRSLEVHGHFPEYGVYITPEALKDPNLKWRCSPHRGAELSLADNRRLVDGLLKAGVPPFMYFYNVHANAQTIRRLFAADLMLGETGKPNIQYHGEPALRAQPDSPFGRHLIEQMDLMLKAYPKAPGFFVDNFAIEWISFAHDDGVTMAHHRPAYTMNRNHQDVGPICFAKAHQAGKVIMSNKLATIESARGVDMVLVEGMSLDGLKLHAFACVYRALFPLAWSGPRSPDRLERCMQHLLVWGGTPAATLVRRRRRDTIDAYRPLTDAMIGKRWVFDADPLALPTGFSGQIFRIDKHAARAGDVVVSLVNLESSWRDEKFTEDLSVTIDLPEAAQLRKATWLGVEKSREKPQPVEIEHLGKKLLLRLPPVGAAGILRLSR